MGTAATLSSKAHRPAGCVRAVSVLTVVCGLVLLAGTAYIYYAQQIPPDSPLARMYRTEADLAALVKAVDTYHSLYGVYPPSGQDGLAKACAALSRTVNYLPDGPPRDGWERPFQYVPSTEYDRPGVWVIRDGGSPCAATTYQVYSEGAGGSLGPEAPDVRRGLIASWDSEKTWRPFYRGLQQQYLQERKAH